MLCRELGAVDTLKKITRVPPTASVIAADTIDASTGRARPLSDQDQKDRCEALARALAEIAEMTDETDMDEIWADVFRGIDESRPHRPLFEGHY
jgi:hypothetical protein